jgi:hypothetical protein
MTEFDIEQRLLFLRLSKSVGKGYSKRMNDLLKKALRESKIALAKATGSKKKA